MHATKPLKRVDPLPHSFGILAVLFLSGLRCTKYRQSITYSLTLDESRCLWREGTGES